MKRISDNIIMSNIETFVNHQKNNRSGHLGHALARCKDGSILAFYSNCSGSVNNGHSMYGWVEYKRSADNGATWGNEKKLEYSYDAFIDGTYKIGCEKAVVTDKGTVVLFCLRSIGEWFEPYATPVCLRSSDNGETWSEPVEVTGDRGRIYDAIYRDGKIYVLQFAYSTDEGFICEKEGVFYKILVSEDDGKSFSVLSEIPFNTMGHSYGNLIFRPDGSLMFYAYNNKDEYHLTALISEDGGKSWGDPFKVYVDKIARNPQIGYINGKYILHARSENGVNFVFYHSDDAINFSSGVIVSELLDGRPRGGCYYSNNLPITDSDGRTKLLIQYSEQYEQDLAKVNIMHATVEVNQNQEYSSTNR